MEHLFKAVGQRLTKFTRKKHPAQLAWHREKWLKIQDDITLKKIDINGLSFYYKARFSMFHTYPDIFVREIYKFRQQSQTPVIIDCGANIGLSVLYFARHYPDATIIAYEPDEQNIAILKKNIDKNFPHNQNIQLRQNAVWIEDADISFFSNGTESSSIINDSGNAQSITVKAVRLKNVLQQYTAIDFLKIDIEGAEYEVIKDCAQELEHVNNMFLEYHGTADETYKLRELMDIVADAGFCIYISLAAEPMQRPFDQKVSGALFDVQLNIFCYRK